MDICNNSVKTVLSLDTISFIAEIAKKIKSDVVFAYPGKNFDDDRAHTALQSIQGRIETLEDFINNLK